MEKNRIMQKKKDLDKVKIAKTQLRRYYITSLHVITHHQVITLSHVITSLRHYKKSANNVISMRLEYLNNLLVPQPEVPLLEAPAVKIGMTSLLIT